MAKVGRKKGFKCSNETKLKMSRVAKEKGFGRWSLGKKHSKETKRKMSLSNKRAMEGRPAWNRGMKGEEYITHFKSGKHPFLGRNHTEKTKKLIKEKVKNIEHNYWLGKHLSLEHREKLRNAKLGQKPSLETRKKLSIARLKRVFPIQDTKIEIKLQNWLTEQGINFKTHYPILGQPDIFIEPNICIFAMGVIGISVSYVVLGKEEKGILW